MQHVFIFIYNSLHVSSTSCSSSGETNCFNITSGSCHCVSVNFRPAHDTATDTEWQLPEVVLTQFVSPDDEHDVLETCRELKNKNKYTEKNCASRWPFTKNSLPCSQKPATCPCLVKPLYSAPSHPISSRSSLLLSYHRHVGLPIALFTSPLRLNLVGISHLSSVLHVHPSW